MSLHHRYHLSLRLHHGELLLLLLKGRTTAHDHALREVDLLLIDVGIIAVQAALEAGAHGGAAGLLAGLCSEWIGPRAASAKTLEEMRAVH